MSNALDPSTIPDKITDAEARALLEQVTPRARKISEDIVRNNARAEQGQAQMATLLAKAREHFGTDDVSEMQRILDERMAKNSQNVRGFLTRLQETEDKLTKVAQAAMVR